MYTSGSTGRPQLKVLCGSEAMPYDLADQLLARCDSLWNMYGATETTAWATISSNLLHF
jgi:non-ribosomal peptide synthetase component F